MNKNSLVKKSNKLVVSRYDLSLIEQKLILTGISMIDRGDKDFRDYRFYVNDYFELTDGNAKENYTQIKRAFRNLASKTLEIKKDDGKVLIASWLSSAEIGRGYVDVLFDPKLKAYLLQLKECFTTYELKNILFLHSIYSVRLYEYLKQYEGLGGIKANVDELKHILKIPNYTISNIKQRILVPVQKELRMLTDIVFEYDFVKHGNKFTEIKFKIKRNPKMPKLLQNGDKGQTKSVEHKTRVALPETQEDTHAKQEKEEAKKIAASCLASGLCEKRVLVPYCKYCENYTKKIKRTAQNSQK